MRRKLLSFLLMTSLLRLGKQLNLIMGITDSCLSAPQILRECVLYSFAWNAPAPLLAVAYKIFKPRCVSDYYIGRLVESFGEYFVSYLGRSPSLACFAI